MSEENLSAVTSEKEPKQDKEAHRARWAWVERRVWTDSMLRSLEKGIKGGKWYALIDKVYELKNLQSGFWKVWRNAGSAGVDGQSVRSFEAKEEQQLQKLAEELRTESYRPAAVKRVWIPKPGSQEKRPLVRRHQRCARRGCDGGGARRLGRGVLVSRRRVDGA